MFQNIFISNRTETEPATVYLWDDQKELQIFPYNDFDYAWKRDKHGNKETIYGDIVSKTFNWSDNTPGIFEGDVPRETRVLTDLYLNSDDVAKDHRVLIFDIEVDSVGGFASIDKANKEITAIGCYDQSNDQYVVFLLDKNQTFIPRQRQIGNESIMAFDTEKELLQAFMAFYAELKPTILTGWNINQYDIPYLYKRLENVFDTDTANMLSPVGLVKYSTYRSQYQLAGISCLDYLEMYQKFTYARRPTYRLDAIGLFEVNMGKIQYEGSLDTLYQNDLHKFIEYNLQDVRIVKAIDAKMKLIDLVKNISHVGHTQYEDYKYSSKYIEGTILTYLHRQNKVASNKSPDGREEFNQRLEDNEEGFSGAYVKEPMPGLYEWVYNLDLQSLYPSIIMSLNISPETKIGYVKNWNLEEHLSGNGNSYILEIGSAKNVLTRDQFIEFMNDEKFMISSNGVLYRSDKQGVIPEILNKWFAERLEYKALQKKHKKEGNKELEDYYDRRQHVQKILLNSIYGVLGLPIFRFYDLDNALAVTATGQDIIKTTAKILNTRYEKMGVTPKTDAEIEAYNIALDETKKVIEPKERDWLLEPNNHCLYIDTDSVYFSAMPFINNDPLKTTVDIAKQMASLLNDQYYNVMAKKMFFCDTHRFVIKPEAVSQTALWVAKKRYAQLKIYDLENDFKLDTPKLAFKGLDVVRSSFPKAFQKIMSDSLMAVLELKNKSDLDKMILDFRAAMNDMKFENVAKNTSVKDMEQYDIKSAKGFKSFPKGCTAHVKASIAYNRWLRTNKVDKTYEPIRDGDKIKWSYLRNNPLGLETMALKGFNDPPELVKFVQEYLDYEMLFEKELKNKLGDFYSARKWGLLPTDINQSAGKFFEF